MRESHVRGRSHVFVVDETATDEPAEAVKKGVSGYHNWCWILSRDRRGFYRQQIGQVGPRRGATVHHEFLWLTPLCASGEYA